MLFTEVKTVQSIDIVHKYCKHHLGGSHRPSSLAINGKSSLLTYIQVCDHFLYLCLDPTLWCPSKHTYSGPPAGSHYHLRALTRHRADLDAFSSTRQIVSFINILLHQYLWSLLIYCSRNPGSNNNALNLNSTPQGRHCLFY